MEIKCDLAVLKKENKDARLDYLNTFLYIIKRRAPSQITSPTFGSYFIKQQSKQAETPERIMQRFNIVLDYKDNPSKNKKILFLFAIVSILSVSSTFFVMIQPFIQPDLSEEGGIMVSGDSVYILKTVNEKYAFFFGNEFQRYLTMDEVDLYRKEEVPIIEEDTNEKNSNHHS